MKFKYTIGETLNHIGSHPAERTWQTPIYLNGQLMFIAIGATQSESKGNAEVVFDYLSNPVK